MSFNSYLVRCFFQERDILPMLDLLFWLVYLELYLFNDENIDEFQQL